MAEKEFSFYGNSETKDLHLYIECGGQHLAFWLEKDSERKKIISFELFCFDHETPSFKKVFEQAEKQSGILNHRYNTVTIIWENSSCICIPEHYFSPDMTDTYINYAYVQNSAGENMFTCNNGFSLVYKTDAEQYNVLAQCFPEAKHFHKYYSFTKAPFPADENHPSQMYVAMFHNYYIISAFNNGQLQFINRLQYDSIPDTVKTIEHVVNQLNRQTDNTALIVSGIIDEQSALFNQLAKQFALLKMDGAEEYSFDNAEELTHSPLYYLPYFKFSA
jgi:hypothetical protein